MSAPSARVEAQGASPPLLAGLQRWSLRGGLFLLPLAHSWTTYDQYVVPKLLLARALLVVLIGCFVARAVLSGTLSVKRTPLDLPILVFLGSAALSTAFAVNVNVALFGIYSRYDGLLTMLTYAGLFWLAVQALDGPDDARALLRTLLASAYVVAALAIGQVIIDSVEQGSVARAYGTLGQWNVLGGFLAMMWPIALRETVDARSWIPRVLSANALILVGVALLLTFSRSAWVGSAAAAAILIATGGRRRIRRDAVAVITALLVLGVATVLAGNAGFHLGQSLTARAMTLFNPTEWGPRFAIWHDTIPLIAGRPVLGYGLDSFGLVFPQFNSVYYVDQVDKAHAETLQIAATQGLVGLAAYFFILAAFARAFWRSRSLPGAAPIMAGLAAYQVALQLNFTALSSALPFWIFAAAALVSWNSVDARVYSLGRSRAVWAAGAPAAGALVALAALGIARPYLADASLLAAVNADASGRGAEARSAAGQAESLGSQESVYAVEAGNVPFERGEWAAARDAYLTAIRLGTYNPAVFRNLAIADRNLGLRKEARQAALGAYYLNRFDPANRALLAEFDASS